MVLYSGAVQWRHTVAPYSGTIQWHRTVVPYNGTIQWCHTIKTCSLSHSSDSLDPCLAPLTPSLAPLASLAPCPHIGGGNSKPSMIVGTLKPAGGESKT